MDDRNGRIVERNSGLDGHMDIAGALAYMATIRNRKHLAYAKGVFAYYRDYDTPRQQGWPFSVERDLPRSTVARIASAIRHYMVGDCDIRGVAI